MAEIPTYPDELSTDEQLRIADTHSRELARELADSESESASLRAQLAAALKEKQRLEGEIVKGIDKFNDQVDVAQAALTRAQTAELERDEALRGLRTSQLCVERQSKLIDACRALYRTTNPYDRYGQRQKLFLAMRAYFGPTGAEHTLGPTGPGDPNHNGDST